MWKKRNKYNAVKCDCVQGHKHDSRGEAGYCSELYYQQKAGLIQGYRIQRMYRLNIEGQSMGYLRVDFEVINKEGKTEIHEYKGFPTRAWLLKVKLFKVCYPEIDYKIIWHGKKR